MSSNKKFWYAILSLFTVEAIYFIVVLAIGTMFRISFSIMAIQLTGILLALGYTFIMDSWTRKYTSQIHYAVASNEVEIKKLKRRVDRLEKSVSDAGVLYENRDIH